jgi:hypothetical protein
MLCEVPHTICNAHALLFKTGLYCCPFDVLRGHLPTCEKGKLKFLLKWAVQIVYKLLLWKYGL